MCRHCFDLVTLTEACMVYSWHGVQLATLTQYLMYIPSIFQYIQTHAVSDGARWVFPAVVEMACRRSSKILEVCFCLWQRDGTQGGHITDSDVATAAGDPGGD